MKKEKVGGIVDEGKGCKYKKVAAQGRVGGRKRVGEGGGERQNMGVE